MVFCGKEGAAVRTNARDLCRVFAAPPLWLLYDRQQCIVDVEMAKLV